MPSYFTVELDTTPPLDLDLIAPTETVTTSPVPVQVFVSDADTTGYQMKVWYEGETTDWISYEEFVDLVVDGAGGTREIHAIVRDDVWNQTEVATEFFNWLIDSTPNVRVKMVVFTGNPTLETTEVKYVVEPVAPTYLVQPIELGKLKMAATEPKFAYTVSVPGKPLVAVPDNESDVIVAEGNSGVIVQEPAENVVAVVEPDTLEIDVATPDYPQVQVENE
jgi:hypothetical protein